MIRINRNVVLQDDELEEHFMRSPGPGGQNVNKVETAVQLRFNAVACPALTEDVVERLRGIAGHLMTQSGDVIITAHNHRTQLENRREAKERLVALLKEALVVPRRRKPTKPTSSSKERRLEAKKKLGMNKKLRQKSTDIL